MAITQKPLDVPGHEAFAQHVVKHGNKARAYRETFSAADMAPRTVWHEACILASRPDVARRIDELIAASADLAVAEHSAALQYAWDVATADPSAIHRTFYTACRHCHGEGFKFQWKDADEYATACAAAPKNPPSCDGGFGFNAHAEPNALCPECLGMGERHEWYCDPTTLTGKEAKLYAGLHPKTGRPYCRDQDAAWDRVCRLMGWNKETVRVPERTVEETGPMTPERAERGYLALVRGGKAG